MNETVPPPRVVFTDSVDDPAVVDDFLRIGAAADPEIGYLNDDVFAVMFN